MLSFLASVSALAVPVLLLLAVVEHVTSPDSFRRALVSQAVLPVGLAWPVALGVMAVEGTLAVSVGVGLASETARGTVLRPGLAAGVLLFAAYAAYTAYLLLRRPGAPCGCSRHDMEVDGWVVVRALGCVGFAGLALRYSDHVVTVTEPGARFAIAVLAAVTFAVVLWHLPAALQDPVRRVVREGRARVRALARGEATT